MLLIFEVSMCVSTLRHLYVNSRRHTRQQSVVGRLLIFRPTMELESITQSSDCPDWTDSKTITLIDLIRQHECLWKVNYSGVARNLPWGAILSPSMEGPKVPSEVRRREAPERRGGYFSKINVKIAYFREFCKLK